MSEAIDDRGTAEAASSAKPWVVGVDIGGTFTDVVALDLASGLHVSSKVLTTPHDPTVGVVEGVERVREGRFAWGDIAEIVHGTTLAINCVLGRRGSKVGMLTTEGFRDVIELGNSSRFNIYDLQFARPDPIVPRSLRVGVRERLRADGSVETPLAAASLDRAIDFLSSEGVESIAVCFIHSYVDNKHERMAADEIHRRLEGLHVSVSSDVAPVVREYERFIATVVNSYVGPTVSSYLSQLREVFIERGFAGLLNIMKSDGGTSTPEAAASVPITILESGPAAGALSASTVAGAIDAADALAFDMGGSTAKACLIQAGKPGITQELEIDRQSKMVRGSGLPIRLPSVDLVEIGAGGNSIAQVTNLGLLSVGPESAASDPGPACYGLGGEDPTVTDADLVLGYLGSPGLAGGAIQLDFEAAFTAIGDRITRSRERSAVVEAAWAIHDLVNERMALAIRLHCIEHDVDPSGVTLIATGGAGPVHATHIMEKLGIARVVCPADAGVASAVGLVQAPPSSVVSMTDVYGISPEDAEAERGLRSRLWSLEEKARTTRDLGPEALATGWLDMRIEGQAYEIRVDVDVDVTVPDLIRLFADTYQRMYGRAPAPGRLEIVQWGVTVQQQLRSLTPIGAPVDQVSAPTSGVERQAYFGPELGWRACPVIDRASVAELESVGGGLLIQDRESTIVVPPAYRATVDEWRHVHIERAR